MSHFSQNETEYLRGQRLGRLATTESDGSPHVVPVGFRLGADGEAIEVGGHGMGASKKWRDLQAESFTEFMDQRRRGEELRWRGGDA
jgi:pyridoxamine 5'-phosphate oxidase family protein